MQSRDQSRCGVLSCRYSLPASTHSTEAVEPGQPHKSCSSSQKGYRIITGIKHYWSCTGLIEAVHPSWVARTEGWSVWRSQNLSSGRRTSDWLCVQGHHVWFALCDNQVSSHCHCILCEPLTTGPLGEFCVKTQASRELINLGGFCVSFSDFCLYQQGGFCVGLLATNRTSILCDLEGLR